MFLSPVESELTTQPLVVPNTDRLWLVWCADCINLAGLRLDLEPCWLVAQTADRRTDTSPIGSWLLAAVACFALKSVHSAGPQSGCNFSPSTSHCAACIKTKATQRRLLSSALARKEWQLEGPLPRRSGTQHRQLRTATIYGNCSKFTVDQQIAT